MSYLGSGVLFSGFYAFCAVYLAYSIILRIPVSWFLKCPLLLYTLSCLVGIYTQICKAWRFLSHLAVIYVSDDGCRSIEEEYSSDDEPSGSTVSFIMRNTSRFKWWPCLIFRSHKYTLTRRKDVDAFTSKDSEELKEGYDE